MKVFISGSIKIKDVPKCAIEKINSIIDKNFQILIGDAKGVDSLIQKYLVKKSFQNVVVYFAGDSIRNNLGNWPTKQIIGNNKEKGRDLYTLKDIEMAVDADYGLMIWDGESKGTLANIKQMKNRNKRFFVIMKEILVLDKNVESIIEMHETNIETKEIQGELF
jgi:hypothetical protein